MSEAPASVKESLLDAVERSSDMITMQLDAECLASVVERFGPKDQQDPDKASMPEAELICEAEQPTHRASSIGATGLWGYGAMVSSCEDVSSEDEHEDEDEDEDEDEGSH